VGVISLEGLEFFAYHGFYEEEQKIGNKYTVDITVVASLHKAAEGDQLAETVNYEDLYRIAATVMSGKSKLLEHVAYQIIEEIRSLYPFVQKVVVSVSKHNPPIGGICNKAKITLEG
jgi:dihydroneopterin aldolase